MNQTHQPPKPPRPSPVPRTTSPRISALLDARNSGHLTDQDLSTQISHLMQQLPLLETSKPNHSIVTFIYAQTEPLESVLLFANRLTDETNLEATLLEKIPATPYWYASFELENSWRASYCFLPTPQGQQPAWLSSTHHPQLRAALDAGQADPANPRHCPNRGGNLLSVVELPQAPNAPYQADYRAPYQPHWSKYTPQKLHPNQGALDYELLPIGIPTDTSPLIITFDGEIWSHQGLPAASAQAVKDEKLQDHYLLLIHSGGREQRWKQLGQDSPLLAEIATGLLPHLAHTYALRLRPERTVLVGQSLGALAALTGVLTYPQIFGIALSQSASLWNPSAEQALEKASSILTPSQRQKIRLYLECGTQEWVLLEPHQNFVQAAHAAGIHAQLTTYNGGHDYACWRNSLVGHLIQLFPAPHNES